MLNLFWGRVSCLCVALIGSAGCTHSIPVSPLLPDSVQPESATEKPLPSGWRLQLFPASDASRQVSVLRREALIAHAKFRVIVIPGSGCTGFAPIAAAYFSGLKSAQVLILHKPYSDVFSGAPPRQCARAFTQYDRLSYWRDDVSAALHTLAETKEPPMPTFLVGISEGGEIIPQVAPTLPLPLMGVVLLSSPGIDPAQAGKLQAQRTRHLAEWEQLEQLSKSELPNAKVVHGRSLAYWRDFFSWSVADALIASSLPLLRVWGGSDLLVPEQAYADFTKQSRHRYAQQCSWRLPEAGHGLQMSSGEDGLQQVWQLLEAWAQSGKLLCPQGDRT